MTEPVFFPAPKPFTIAEIIELVGARPVSGVDVSKCIDGVAALESAGSSDITFFGSLQYSTELAATSAAVCLCAARNEHLVPPTTLALVTDQPHRAFARVAAAIFPSAVRPTPVFEDIGVSPRANVHADAKIEAGATIEAGSVVGPRAEIGRDTLIAAGSVVGPEVRIGRDSAIGPRAVVTHALLGDRVIIHAGVCVGQDGFGFVPGDQGHTKTVQIGRVVIQDDVEIGANTTIDRGSNRDTVVGEGTKIDNLVQIGHNVVIGRNCLIAGQTGVSGSVTIGDMTFLGGKVGVRDNIAIGRGAVIAASSSVGTDVPDGARWGGTPARPIKDWLRENAALRRLTERRTVGLEKKGSKK